MAALAMTPKLLGRISNEKYQEKDNWKIDDFALGPANELLISGHNLKTPKTFISMYKEDSGKYGNRPEFNRNFRQPQPGEQLVLFLEGSSIIGLKIESALRLVSIKGLGVLKTLNWKQSPTCALFYRGKLYAASSSSNIVSVFKLDPEEKSDIILSDMRRDRVLEMVVVMEKLYVCTKDAGRALVFSMTGLKEMEFKNANRTGTMAMSICCHERTELVFVSWSNFQIQLYSQKTSQCLRAIDMTEKLLKIRVTAKNILVTSSASKCIVSVYDLGEVIGEFDKNILSLVKKKRREKSMSHDEEKLECRPANDETHTSISFPWKSASKQSKVEKLRDTKELHLKQLKEHENLPRKSDRDIHELNEKIKYLEDMRTEHESQQKELKDTLAQEKGKVTRAEGSRVQAVKNLKKVEERNTKLEDEVTQLKLTLLAEEETTKKAETSFLMLNEKIKYLEYMGTELDSQQKELKDTLAQEKEKVTRAEGSRVQAENALEKSEKTRLVLQKKMEEKDRRLLEEERKVEGQKTSLLSAETSRKSLEKKKVMVDKQNEDLTKQLAAEQSEGKELKESLSKATTSIEKLEKAKVILGKENEDLYQQLSTEKRNTERQKAALSKISITKHNESMKSSLLHIRSVIDKTLPEINEHRTLQVHQLDSVHEKKYNEDLEGTTSSRRTGRTSRFLQKMQKRLSRENESMLVEKMQQEEYGYTTDSTTDNESTSGYETPSEFEWGRTLSPGSDAKIQHDEPGITTDPATDHEADARSHVFNDTSDTDTVKGDSDEEEILDEQSKQEVCARVSVEGANLQIAETGVSLSIPPGALSEEQTIRMKIIPQPCDAQAALKFECNSAVVVELLPNNCSFQSPVSLTLPHCLQLKEEYERNSIDVLISHHDEGFKPKWELLHDARFNLCKENCTISLKSFCWVTYEIHDKIVEAKRIKLYTAGKKMRLNDRITEVEVGFYPDLPGSGKILELNKDMHLSQRKPYVFLKTGEEPLLINLHKLVPKEWNNSQPDENPKIIPFDSVSISEERSCPFVLERSGDDTDIPLCIFKVGQKGRSKVELTIRPDVLTP